MTSEPHAWNDVITALEADVNDLLGVALPAVEEYGRWRKLQVRATRVGTRLVRIGVSALDSEQLELAACTKRLATITATIDARVRRAASRLEPGSS